jgi:hypothetical protein
MSFEWFATEHHRLHIVEEWADGPHKEAALAAIHSTLEGLMRNQRPNTNLPVCEVCLGRVQPEPVRFPDALPIQHAELAA